MGVYWSLGQRPTVNPRALIFDMDGVIVDSEALHESAKRQALRSAGIEVDELVFAQYTGRTDRAMITDLAGPDPKSTIGQMAASLVKENSLVLFDSGWTSLAVAKNVPVGL